MTSKPTTDVDLTAKDVRELISEDAICSFLTRLDYPTGCRKQESPSTYGLSADTADAIEHMELMAEDEDSFLRVMFVRLKSITAKARNELARNLGRRSADHLLILTKDFLVTEFVLIDKETRQRTAPGRGPSVRIIPRVVTVDRKAVGSQELRVLRRLTWTGKDGLDQFDKLRSVFESAYYSSRYFQNRALFADHYLEHRLPEDPAWSDSPNEAFNTVKRFMADARRRWANKDERVLREELFDPALKTLRFKAKVNKSAKQDHLEPDYILHGANGKPSTVAFTYRWDRWLDGADPNDPDTPEENPGACVVSALSKGDARWVIVTNGKLWRLYSRDAHSRATNFYEVDLEEALIEADDTDPNRAFRYWWLFFRGEAFEPHVEADKEICWLDTIVEGSRDYAKRLGERLKDRAFLAIFPHLAQGFLAHRRRRNGKQKTPSEQELRDTFEATLTLLYRLLFLLYAEARDLLPIREAAYREASFRSVKEEVAKKAGTTESAVAEKLKVYSDKDTTLYDRLTRLFVVMDEGDPILNVPCYNGGLFVTQPDAGSDAREHRIAGFLRDNKVPDRYLALAIDRLARDQDEKTFELVFIDYKSLEVRHLGSIYEGLLEFKLKVAEEDLATKTEKKREKYIPLTEIKAGRGRRRSTGGDARATAAVVRKGEVYLSNDKAERKATGSYYTPDPIVEYIVEHTVGPVLDEKLEALRPELDKASKTYHRHLKNAENNPGLVPSTGGTGVSPVDPRAFAAAKTYAEHHDLVDRVFDMKTLDPAMGSGHFLVETVDFITDRLLDFLNRYPRNPVRFMLDKTRRSILDALGEQGVTVDPDKLTDINLLKRHVLKRCIYGVDLNPMAVELAKVSLWLDAFTLGAPLSFLDHHLRCGNSLIGATFDDLKKATEGQLFAIDYEPLLRAIQHVLFVNAMADATAAEVHQSASEYAQARKELSGYQIVLDLLVADHFVDCGTGVPPVDQNRDRKGAAKAPTKPTHGHKDPTSFKPSSLLKQATDLDLTTRDKLMASLNERDTRLVQQVEAVSSRPDLRFFHWEIEFPEVFFGFADSEQRQIRHRNDIAVGSAGFDAVVGNPPYDVLSSKEIGVDISALQAYIASEADYAPARHGKQNLYKLFICCGVGALRRGGQLGHIVPMALLGDDQAAGIRQLLLSTAPLRAVEAFPQKDDPNNRVFPEAKLSTCVFISARSDEKRPPFRSRVHPGKELRERAPSVVLRPKDVGLYDPENQPIIACGQDDWDLAVRVSQSGRVRRLGEFCQAFQGEVNETTDGAKGHLSTIPKDGSQILRGSNVCLYALREASQGEPLFLRKSRYLNGKKPGAKAWHHKQRRTGFQRNSPQNNFRRLIACIVPEGEFCCDTVSYVPRDDSQLPLPVVIALLNSKFLDWFFRLGSTNSKVNDYQFCNLPTPDFDPSIPRNPTVSDEFRSVATRADWVAARGVVEPLLETPPFGPTVMDCMEMLVQLIIDIEDRRGEIARAERSALDPEAQPIQDLLDHMIYRMAGLTDADIAGLEERLTRML